MFYFLVYAIPTHIQFVSNLELLVALEKIYVNENVLVSLSACMCVYIHETKEVKKHYA